MILKIGDFFEVIGILRVLFGESSVDIQCFFEMTLGDIKLGERFGRHGIASLLDQGLPDRHLAPRGGGGDVSRSGSAFLESGCGGIARIEHADRHESAAHPSLVARLLVAIHEEALCGEIPGGSRNRLFEFARRVADLIFRQVNFAEKDAGGGVGRVVLEAARQKVDGLIGIALLPVEAGKRKKRRGGRIVGKLCLESLNPGIDIA